MLPSLPNELAQGWAKDKCVRMLRAASVMDWTTTRRLDTIDLTISVPITPPWETLPIFRWNQLLGFGSHPKPKISKLAIPHAILHPLDDPIFSTWKTNAVNEGWMRPDKLVQLANESVLLTQKGSHVGWPVGWRSAQHGREFMNEGAASFVDAVVRGRRRRRRGR